MNGAIPQAVSTTPDAAREGDASRNCCSVVIPQNSTMEPQVPRDTPVNRSKVIASNSIWIALDTFVGLAGAMIASVTLARMLGPVKLGYYGYMMWVANVAGALAVFGIP